MNKNTLRTIFATAIIMFLLFAMAIKLGWISDRQQIKWNETTNYNKNSKAKNNTNNENNSQKTNSNKAIAHNNEEANTLHLLDHERKIILTQHAKCRMDCRHFTNEEVQEILESGTINFQKSNDRPGNCPTYALEGETQDGQQARMVFAFCDENSAKLITVIDLETDWKCNCY
jgi:hypothetical protein